MRQDVIYHYSWALDRGEPKEAAQHEEMAVSWLCRWLCSWLCSWRLKVLKDTQLELERSKVEVLAQECYRKLQSRSTLHLRVIFSAILFNVCSFAGAMLQSSGPED